MLSYTKCVLINVLQFRDWVISVRFRLQDWSKFIIWTNITFVFIRNDRHVFCLHHAGEANNFSLHQEEKQILSSSRATNIILVFIRKETLFCLHQERQTYFLSLLGTTNIIIRNNEQFYLHQDLTNIIFIFFRNGSLLTHFLPIEKRMSYASRVHVYF